MRNINNVPDMITVTVKILKIGTPEKNSWILQCSIVFKKCRQNNKQRRP